MPGAPCDVEPAGRRRRLLRWRGLGLRRRRRLPVARLGGDYGGCRVWRGRGILFLRRLRLRWLTARWLRRAARGLAAIYLAALAGPPTPSSSSTCPPWIGLEPCFATPFVGSTRPCW